MYNNYLKTNFIARQFANNQMLFENEKIDNLLQKISDTSLEIFKRMNFDIAPKKDRRLDVMKVKLSDIASSKTSIEALAKIKEYSEDNDISDGNYSDAKDLYMKSLDNFIEAMKALREVSKEKDSVFIKNIKSNAEELQSSLNELADKILNKEKKSLKESIGEIESFNDFQLNEAINLGGYKGRIKRLRDRLTDLISSAENKNSRDGYSRDWKREFLALEKKLSALDTTRGGTGTKEKKTLRELEKLVDRVTADFNKSIIATAEKELRNIQNDNELRDLYGDIVKMITKALDNFSTATASQKLGDEAINDKIEDKEVSFNENVFPIKRGNSDSDEKFEDSDLIRNIQRGLMNGVIPIKTFLQDKGGADGKYGNATSAVIASIQKQSGNKNITGEIDKETMDILLISDFIGPEDREKIIKSLDILRENNLNESKIPLFKDIKIFEAEKLKLDKEEIIGDMDSFYKEYVNKDKTNNQDFLLNDEKNITENAKKLAESTAKILRIKLNLKIESEDFLNAAGGLKKKYNGNFLKAWKYSAENSSKEEIFYFVDGGIYAKNYPNNNARAPLNINKWIEISGDDKSDFSEFIENYHKVYRTIGKLNRKQTFETIERFFKEVNRNFNIEIRGVYKRIEKIINNPIAFISLDDLKGPISKAFKTLIQEAKEDRGDADLGIEDFIGLNNLIILLAGVFTNEGKKFRTSASWIRENIMTDDVIKRLNSDGYYNSYNPNIHGPILFINEGGMKMITKSGVHEGNVRAFFGSAMKEVFGKVPENNKFSTIHPKIKKEMNLNPTLNVHLRRMNSINFSEVPQEPTHNQCIEITEEVLKEEN